MNRSLNSCKYGGCRGTITSYPGNVSNEAVHQKFLYPVGFFKLNPYLRIRQYLDDIDPDFGCVYIRKMSIYD